MFAGCRDFTFSLNVVKKHVRAILGFAISIALLWWVLRDVSPSEVWHELTREETFAADERFKLDERLRKLNSLGFDVEEIQLNASPEGYRLQLDPRVVEPGHHRHRLLRLTGLDTQENQARRMLNDIARFREAREREEKRPLSESVAASRWDRVGCPVCGGRDVQCFFEAANVPVRDGLLFDSAQEAAAAPTGNLRLSVCKTCFYIGNEDYQPRKARLDGYDFSLQHSPAFRRFVRALSAR